MKIIIRDYPSTFSFDTEEKLPIFQYGCHVRTKIVQQEIIQQQIETPCHDPFDYCVEVIIPFKDGEIWELGS
jgi:hypothetical protein